MNNYSELPPVIAVGKRPSHTRRILAPAMLAAVLAFAGATAVQAQQPLSLNPGRALVTQVTPAGAPARTLGTWTSHPGESKKDFILRLSVPLHEFTHDHGVEACGVLAHNQKTDQWRVHVTTNDSHMGCVRVVFDDPGFTPTPETIHTHPRGTGIALNREDVSLFPGRGILGGHARYDLHPNKFSAHDYANGPGYVVIPGHWFGGPEVLYQDHPGENKVVGKVPVQLSAAATAPDPHPKWDVAKNQDEGLSVRNQAVEVTPASTPSRRQ